MILVTGGTGLVGSHLLFFLLKDNKTVRAVHRKESNPELVKQVFSYYTSSPETFFERIDWIEADITDLPALTEAFRGITHVYHTAAYISFNPVHYHKLKKANIEGTANIVNLCLEFNIEKLCYVSSVGALGKVLNGKLITEETSWNPEANNSVYAITKYGAEMEVWRGTQEGLDAVIVQPGVILGPSGRESGSGRILKSISKGIGFYTSGGMGFVGVRDVVKAMIQLMNSPLKNDHFILVAYNMKYKDLLTALAKNLQKKPPEKKAPKWVLSLISSLDYIAHMLFGTKRKLFKATVRSLYTESYYDASKIERELGFSFCPLEEALQQLSENHSRES
jgi:nucleoside-diphosphate-sugar epimerase